MICAHPACHTSLVLISLQLFLNIPLASLFLLKKGWTVVVLARGTQVNKGCREKCNFIDNQRHDPVVVWETSDLCTCILIDRARALKHYTRSAPCCDNFKRRSLVSMSSKSQNLKDTLMET